MNHEEGIPRLHKFLYWLSLVGIFLCLTVIGVVYYLVFLDKSQVTEFTNLPFPTDKEEYQVGDVISFHVEYCKEEPIPPKVTISLVTECDQVQVVSEFQGKAASGCRSFKNETVVIPASFRSCDSAFLDGVAEYGINALNTARIPFRTQTFKITNASEK